MKVTREDLYRRVWETPMSRLALEFGVTGNGLAKACRKLNVPYPPRGYWAKKAAGKTPPTPPLPTKDNDTPAATDIRGIPPRPKVSSQAQSEAEAVKKRTNIRVPQRLNRPHPIIAGWLEQHEERKKKAERAVDPFTRQLWRPSPFTELQRRRHRILDSLFKALEKEGAAVREGKSGLFVATINRAEITFQLREKNRQIKRSNRDANSDRRPSQGWEPSLEPTGFLLFSFKVFVVDGFKKEWLESDNKCMEDLLPDIFATFIVAADSINTWQKKRDEEQRQRRAEQERRDEERRRQQLEETRWTRFAELAEAWHRNETIRAFLEALKAENSNSQDHEGDPEFEAWIRWAEDRVAANDPLKRGGKNIFVDVANVTLNPWNFRRY